MARTCLIVLSLSALLLSGCLYSHITLPYGTELDKTEMGGKAGRASNVSVLWLVAWGDAGSAAAARNGGITVMNHMDQEILVVLFGVYSRHTTIVYGN